MDESIELEILGLMGKELGLYFLARKEICEFLKENGFKPVEIFVYLRHGIDISGKMFYYPKLQSFEFYRVKYEKILWQWFEENKDKYIYFKQRNQGWFVLQE